MARFFGLCAPFPAIQKHSKDEDQEGERKEKFLKKVEQRKSFPQYIINALLGAKEHLD